MLSKPTYSERKFIPHVTAVGQVALAWNDLQDHLGALFTSIIGASYGQQEVAIWNSAKFDRPQREMLKSVVKNLGDDKAQAYPKLTEDVLWVLEQSDKLEDARNNVVHAPMSMIGLYGLTFHIPKDQLGKVIPNVNMKHLRALNLEKKDDLLAECRWCRDTSLVLRDFVGSMHYRLLFNDHPEWPKKPVLPGRGKKAKSTPPRKRKRRS